MVTPWMEHPYTAALDEHDCADDCRCRACDDTARQDEALARAEADWDCERDDG